MKVPMNERCYAVDCNKRQAKDQFFCKEHMKQQKVKTKPPGVAAFDNTPAKI